MAKAFGYFVSIVGIFGIVLYTFPEVAVYSGIPSNLIGMPLMILSIIVAFLGVLLVVKNKGGGKQPKEVPIYRGNKIVGYRQHGK